MPFDIGFRLLLTPLSQQEQPQSPTYNIDTINNIDTNLTLRTPMSTTTEVLNMYENEVTPLGDENENKNDEEESEKDKSNNDETTKQPIQQQQLQGQTRPQRIIHNLPKSFCSPFMVRYKDFFKDMDTVKAVITDYALSDGDQTESLYYDGMNSINRLEMKTMAAEEEVMNCVVDSWSKILNNGINNENQRKKDILYFGTMPFMFMCTNHIFPKSSTIEERLPSAIERMTEECKLCKSNINNINMFFFPCLYEEHYYLLCMNKEKKTMFIIDNRMLPERIDEKDKYGDRPDKMLKLLAEWLKENNCKDWNIITEFRRVLLQMLWKSKSDVKNCGIYLTHHIETFNGEENW